MRKKRNNGQSLENFVKLIEEWLMPKGFNIECRKQIYEGGIQIAELDIVITNQTGTEKYLLECRDRPSEGAAPVGWIEQLIGRRLRFNFNKVMAVSTTGFSKGAIIAANQNAIELRLLQDLNYQTISNWLPYNAPVIIRNGELQASQVFLEPTLEFKDYNALPISIHEPIFRHNETGHFVTLLQLWQNVIHENSQLFNDIELNTPPQKKFVSLNSPKYQLLSNEILISINHIDFEGLFSVTIPTMPISKVSAYTEVSNEKIADLVQWKGNEGDAIKEIILIARPKKI